MVPLNLRYYPDQINVRVCPTTFNTPKGTSSSIKLDNRGWSSEINEIETFSSVVRNKKTNILSF